MFKWDRISWIASGIFVIGVVLGMTVNFFFFFLLAIAYLLRPALLAFGLTKHLADERQMSIQFHSGNIALIIVIVALMIFAYTEDAAGRHADNYYFLLALALAAKAVVGLVMNGDFTSAAVRISVFAALMILLFVTAENGLSLGMLMEGIPGFVILIAGLVGWKKPLIGAIFFAVLAVGTSMMFGVLGGFTASRVYMSLLLSIPLLVVGFCFYKGWRGETGEEVAVE